MLHLIQSGDPPRARAPSLLCGQQCWNCLAPNQASCQPVGRAGTLPSTAWSEPRLSLELRCRSCERAGVLQIYGGGGCLERCTSLRHFNEASHPWSHIESSELPDKIPGWSVSTAITRSLEMGYYHRTVQPPFFSFLSFFLSGSSSGASFFFPTLFSSS